MIADFNGDGRGDIAVANGGGTVTILIQDAPGEFQELTDSPFSTGGAGPVGIAAGRVDDNASVDLVIANTGGASEPHPCPSAQRRSGVEPATGSPMNAAAATRDVILADFDGDDELDIASNGVWLRFGLGDGTFETAKRISSWGSRRVR